MSTPASAPHSAHAGSPAATAGRLCGLVAEFETVGAIKAAAARVRDAGYTRWDTHTPFPVHGMDGAMGIRRTKLPYIVFACGVTGALLGIGLQWWTNATNIATTPAISGAAPNFLQGYNFSISGKPDWSFPANIPIIFELTVLLAAFGAVIGMLVLNDLPKHYQPLLLVERFRRASADRFFLSVDAADPHFSREATATLLRGAGAAAIDEVRHRATPPLPWWITPTGITVALLLLIPPAIIAYSRVGTSAVRGIHPIQDMDNQEKFKAQTPSRIFADGMTPRLPVGASNETPAALLGTTVARGETRDDAHYYTGWVNGAYAETFPARVKLTDELLLRGQDRFNIYCAPCHGFDGSGRGMVNERALALAEPGWIQAAALYDDERLTRPVGHLFNSITNGVRTMPAYADKLDEADRWAVVAYIRAIQRAHRPAPGDIPAARQEELRRRQGGSSGR